MLAPHIEEVTAAAQALLQSCSAELGAAITPSQLETFPGFPDTSVLAPSGLALGTPRKLLVRPMRASQTPG